MRGRIIFLSLVLVLLNACGGGGSGGEDTSSATSKVTTGSTLVYTGSTELATLTKDNAHHFAGALMGASEEAANTPAVTASLNSSPAIQHQGILRTSLELSNIIHSADQQLLLNRAYLGAALTSVDRVENCNQGTIHYQGSLNDNGTGKITATYDHCNQDGQLQSGVMIYTINGVDTLGTNLTDAIIQLQQFSIKGTDGDALLEGTIHTQFDPNKNTGTDTFNIVFIDNVLGLVGKVENLIVTTLYSNLANSAAHNDSMTGRLFLAPYGYVDIATIAQLIYDTDLQSSPNAGGPIVLSGKQNTRLSLIPKSSSFVTLELDSDGDNFNELATTLAWNQLSSKQPTPNPQLTPHCSRRK